MRGGTRSKPTHAAYLTLLGVFHCLYANFILTISVRRPCLPYIEKAGGYIIVTSAEASHTRFPGASDYHISKHAINRLVEYIVLGKPVPGCCSTSLIRMMIQTEHPTVKAFSVHPGIVKTELADNTGLDIRSYDTPRLAAATLLHLTSGRADWLSGRYANPYSSSVSVSLLP